MRKAEIDPGKYRKQMRRHAFGHGDHHFRNFKSAAGLKTGAGRLARIGAVASTIRAPISASYRGTLVPEIKRAAFSGRHVTGILGARRTVSTGRSVNLRCRRKASTQGPKRRNMWTRSRRLLRRSHAIL